MRRILIAALFGAPLLIAGPAAAAIAGAETSKKADAQSALTSALTPELISSATLDELLPEGPADSHGVQVAGDSNARALWWLQLGIGNRWHGRDYRRHHHRHWDHDRRWRKGYGGPWHDRRWWHKKHHRRHGGHWRHHRHWDDDHRRWRHRDWDDDDHRWRGRHDWYDDDHRWRSRRDWDDDDHRWRGRRDWDDDDHHHRRRHHWDDDDHDYRWADGRRHR